MKQTVAAPMQNETRQPFFASSLVHTAVHTVPQHDAVANPAYAAGQQPGFGRDFSQTTVQASSSPVGRDYGSVTCPVFPQRCPFGGACHTCPVVTPVRAASAQVSAQARPQEEECVQCGDERRKRRSHEAPPDAETDDDEELGYAEEVDPRSGSGLEAVPPVGGKPAGLPDGPHDDSATIVCDGNGGYRVSMGWAAKATCGIGDCVRQHEESHATDWRARFPNGCKKADGTNKPDGTDVPTGGVGYEKFLRESECRAYTGEVPCGEQLLAKASAGCKKTVEDQLGVWRARKASYCS